MTKINLSELLDKARYDGLVREEENLVRQQLVSGSKHRPYSLINILGHCPPRPENVAAVAQFFDDPDPMVIGMAVSVMLARWNRAERFVPMLVRFLKGIDQDEDGQLRIRTISSIGEWLGRNDNVVLAQALADIYLDPDEDPFVAGVAERALRRATGESHKEILDRGFDDEPDLEMLAKLGIKVDPLLST